MESTALSQLKTFLKEQKIDFFLLPNSDEFFSEYLPESEKRIEFLTGFTGSNATVIFGQNKSYFFTDGRYTLQAKNQLDAAEFEIINMAEKSVISWINSTIKKAEKLALDPKLVSVNFVENIAVEKIFLSENPLNKIWKNRPQNSSSNIFVLSENLCGLDSISKRKIITKNLEADALVITRPENLCWLLNIRASDIEFNPLCLAYAILFKSGKVELFLDEKRCEKLELSDVNIVQSDCFDLRISALKKEVKKIQFDFSSTNYWLYSEFKKNNFELISKSDPIEILKAQKNAVEISGMKKSHEADGIALTKFLFWLEKSLKSGVEIDEIKAAEKLLELRGQNKNFLYPSFATISSFASNGAIIHYHATEKTNKIIKGDSLFLLDSGGQYFGAEFCGTTDVTRTIAIGNPTPEMIENFTRVLKGNIALSRAKFPRGTSGAQLDSLARNFLWLAGKDYEHGTGHGVGAFLAVHEGPCGISKRSHQPLLEGMILSNEPGFYKAGEYGIRVENLMLVEEFDEKFLRFKTLTLAPIDPALIDFKMMTYPEKKWLKEYHETVFEAVKSSLNEEETVWLKNLIERFRTGS
jgi:Xaa-Pro aminopeptidase